MGMGQSKSKTNKPNVKKSKVSGGKSEKNLKDIKKQERVKKNKKLSKKGRKDEEIGDSQNKPESGPAALVGQGKGDFAELVFDALRANFDLITLSDIETYISARHRSTVDAFNRRKIIQKVVADEFLKGCIAVRSTKGNCP